MADAPVQTEDGISAGTKWPEPRRDLDPDTYTPDTGTALELPPVPDFVDRTGVVEGQDGGVESVPQDRLTELTKKEVIRMLRNNKIDVTLTDGLARMSALRLTDTLAPVLEQGIRFSKVRCTPESGRRENTSFSYSEFAANLQRQTVAAAKIGAGVPAIFKGQASYKDSSATAEYTKKVSIHLQSTQMSPRATVVFDEKDISLTPAFVTAVTEACDAESATDLLDALRKYGHYVPLGIVLGGRITVYTDTSLSSETEADAAKQEFSASADASLAIDGVPVDVGGGAGVTNQTKKDTTQISQSKALLMDLMGGDVSLASSKPGTVGAKWFNSLGPFLSWGTIGFAEDSLVPTIDFLEPKLRERCKKLLRAFFVKNLYVAKTDHAGDPNGPIFELDKDTLRRVRRITSISLKHGINLDVLGWTYELYGGATGEKKDIGYGNGHLFEEIEFMDGEELRAIDCGFDPDGGMLRRLAFETNKRRIPPHGHFGTVAVKEYHTIQAPRVIGFFGNSGANVHCIGLHYLALANRTHSSEFLLAMQPYLFAKDDFGVNTSKV